MHCTGEFLGPRCNSSAEIRSCEALKNGKTHFLINMPKKSCRIVGDKLKQLYENGVPLKSLEKYFNCSEATIYYHLHNCGVNYRRPKNIPISKIAIEELYYNQKKTMAEIADKYGCDAVTISNRMKMYGLTLRDISEAHYKFPKKDFSGNLLEKAYLIGFRLGDLHIRKFEKNGKVINASCASPNINQIALFSELFKGYCAVTVSKPNANGVSMLNANLNESFNFLLRKNDEIENWILSDEKLFLAFLAGYVDAEGSIKVHRQGFATFRLGSYDKNILKQTKIKLEEIGFKGVKLRIETRAGTVIHGDKKEYRMRQDFWRLSIYKKFYLKKFFRLIKPFIKHGGKLADITEAEHNIDDRNRKYGNIRFYGS